MMAKTKKRRDGLYQKSITVGRREDGSYIRKSVYAKTQKELDKKVQDMTAQLTNGIRIHENDVTFSAMAELWLTVYHPDAKPTWIYQNGQILKNHLLPVIGGMSIKDLHQLHLQSIITSMSKHGYSTSTMSKVKNIAHSVMQKAVSSDFLMRNPFEDIAVPSIRPKVRLPVTESQITLVTHTWEGHRMGIGAMLMLYAGLRKGELLALEWSDIDFRARIIHVTKAACMLKNITTLKGPKSDAGIREIPIPDILYQALCKVRGIGGLVCPSASGELMSKSSYMRLWDSYMNYLGKCAAEASEKEVQTNTRQFEPFTAHQLRHAYATILFDAGVDIKSAQRFLGHSDIEVTLEIYTHLSSYKVEKAVSSLNEHLNRKQDVNKESIF